MNEGENCQLLLHYRERTAMHPSLDNSCATITESSAVNLNAAQYLTMESILKGLKIWN